MKSNSTLFLTAMEGRRKEECILFEEAEFNHSDGSIKKEAQKQNLLIQCKLVLRVNYEEVMSPFFGESTVSNLHFPKNSYNPKSNKISNAAFYLLKVSP